MRPLILATTLLAFLGPSAFAQTQTTTSPGNSSQMNAASSQNNQTGNPQSNSSAQNTAVQQIRQDLQKAGFTDVKVVAQSFVVQARSKDGNPVVMTIGPHGMSVFEAMNSGSSGSGTVGSGSGGSNSTGSGMGASSTQTPGTKK
jgi:hypothetical protein